MTYSAIQQKRNELIRKALNGSAFIAPYSASPITNLTQSNSSQSAIATTITANTTIGATSVSSTVTVPAGRVITIGAGAGAETVTTTGAPTGTGPYLVPVPALTKAHSSGDALTASAVAAGVDLAPLPTGYQDAGWMTSAGVAFAEAISSNTTNSWGSTEPTRDDIITETTTAALVLQETKALSIGLYTRTDPTGVQAAMSTGEVQVTKPVTPSALYYRLLALAVDTTASGEIYVARFLPRAKVTSKGNQPLSLSGTDGITWEVTFTGFNDSVLGYSERFIFGGPGWQALGTSEHGFVTATS